MVSMPDIYPQAEKNHEITIDKTLTNNIMILTCTYTYILSSCAIGGSNIMHFDRVDDNDSMSRLSACSAFLLTAILDTSLQQN